jgi:hypothetical protein
MQPEISPPEDDSSLNTWQGRIAKVSTRKNFLLQPLTHHQVGGSKRRGESRAWSHQHPPGRTASNKQPLSSNMSLSHGQRGWLATYSSFRASRGEKCGNLLCLACVSYFLLAQPSAATPPPMYTACEGRHPTGSGSRFFSLRLACDPTLTV